MDNATNFVDYLERAWQDSNKRAADFKGGTRRNAVLLNSHLLFTQSHSDFMLRYGRAIIIYVYGAKWHQKQGPREECQDLILNVVVFKRTGQNVELHLNELAENWQRSLSQ